jgi:hypothetical protein
MSSHHELPRALDHLVLPVHALDEARARLTRLGFTVAPDARHPFGTENACVFFADNTYLEPLGVASREECEAAVGKLAALTRRSLLSLRDVSLEDIKIARPYLPAVFYNRSRYIVEENIRVQEAAAALRAGDLQSLGYFMGRSHAGLRDLFQVSCAELDLIVETAAGVAGVLGARMTGAGFGGCAVTLLEQAAVDEACARIKQAFSRKGWDEPRFYITAAARGVTVERVNDSSESSESKGRFF